MNSPRTRQSRRLATLPVPDALDLIACGSAVGTLPRRALEPVVQAMVVSWLPRTQPAWAEPANLVIAKLLDWLENHPGNDWQARWIASGADAYPRAWMTNAGIEGPLRHELASLTINALIILRAICPTLDWLTGIPRLRLRDDWTIHHDTAIFATLRSRLEDDNSADRADSIGHLFRLSITTGRGLAALKAGDFREARESLVRLGRRKRNLDVAWRHLRQLGLLEGQPEEFSQVLAKGRLAPSELVDRYGVRDPDVRRLLVEYLTERESDCDYSTLRTVALHVVKLFWVDLEAHETGIRSLALTTAQATDWKRRLQTLPTGRPRTNWPAVAQNVRSFYLDLAAWAQDDPARWAPWVAPSPIGNRELRVLAPRRRRRQIAENERPHAGSIAGAAPTGQFRCGTVASG